MDTILMNLKNNKTSNPHRLFLSLLYKISLKKSDKFVALSNLSIHCKWKNMKKLFRRINLKHQL